MPLFAASYPRRPCAVRGHYKTDSARPRVGSFHLGSGTDPAIGPGSARSVISAFYEAWFIVMRLTRGCLAGQRALGAALLPTRVFLEHLEGM